MNQNVYDIADYPQALEDIGAVINGIIADIKSRQQGESRPGAVILIPSGDYPLRTPVLIDISYLKIQGCGHGFTSSSIRFNTSEEALRDWHEKWPGGSRILVELEECAAFTVRRSGDPRISSVEFENFNIDGLHFRGGDDPENTYLNGLTGILVDCENDSFRFTQMGLIYLEHGIVCRRSDAVTIHDNFIAECGSCVELLDFGQVAKITDNLIGAGYRADSILIQNYAGALVANNNVFPRGKSSLRLSVCVRCGVTGNRFHSFYPGMLVMDSGCAEVLIASNHFLRDHEPWPPMQRYDSGADDTLGLIVIAGDDNSLLANHISETIEPKYLKPENTRPVIIRVKEGHGNRISDNHIVATAQPSADQEDQACYMAQIGALLSTGGIRPMPVIAVMIDSGSYGNIITDTCDAYEARLDRKVNRFRPLPAIESGTI